MHVHITFERAWQPSSLRKPAQQSCFLQLAQRLNRKCNSSCLVAVVLARCERWRADGWQTCLKWCGHCMCTPCRTLPAQCLTTDMPVLGCFVADAVQELVDMPPEELASDSKRRENHKIRQEAAAEAVRGQTQQASTDMFK